jgi:hypothetical protein
MHHIFTVSKIYIQYPKFLLQVQKYIQLPLVTNIQNELPKKVASKMLKSVELVIEISSSFELLHSFFPGTP